MLPDCCQYLLRPTLLFLSIPYQPTQGISEPNKGIFFLAPHPNDKETLVGVFRLARLPEDDSPLTES